MALGVSAQPLRLDQAERVKTIQPEPAG
jgi:hypothetical protein